MSNPRETCPDKCPRKLINIISPKIQGVGPSTAKIMLVGEAPGQDEDEEGSPFVGVSGQLLNQVLQQVGIDREDLYITNAVKCATPKENIKPTKKEINLCRAYLIEEIERVKPTVIVCLGAVALEGVLKRAGITKLKNNVFYSEEFKTKVIPVWHPAYILRNPIEESTLIAGFELVKREAESSEILKKDETKTKYRDLSKSPEKIDLLLDKLESLDEFVIDLETTSLITYIAKIICFAFSWGIGVGVTVRYDAFSKKQLERLSQILSSKKTKVGHNIKYDIQVLMANNIKIRGPYFDTMVAMSLINENVKEKGLDALVLRDTNMGEYWLEIEDYKKEYCRNNKIKSDAFSYDLLPYEMLARYAQKDADATFRLYRKYKKELIRQNLWDFYQKYSAPIMKVLVQIEYKGIKVDTEKLEGLIKDYTVKLKESNRSILEDETVKKYQKIRLKRLAKKHIKKWEDSRTLKSRFETGLDYAKARIKKKDVVFNPGSPKQLGEILFKVLDLVPVKFTEKKAPSTDEESLTIFAEEHGVEVCKKILEFRGLQKFLSTYLIGTKENAKVDGRFHPDVFQHRTVTGRLSGNFQQVPRDAHDYKDCLIADPGYVFVKADLAQAEFRCWAHYSEDEDMINDIASGLDIHTDIASEIFDIPKDKIAKDSNERIAAKNCVSGNTWVPTASGFKQIKEIQIDDTILDHKNRKQKVLEAIKKKGTLYRVDTEGGSVECTKDHPFFTINRHGKIIEKTLGKLRSGDYILSCTPKNLSTKYFTWKYAGERKTSFKPIFDTWTLNEDLGFLLGFILAEGSIQKHGTCYSVSWGQKGKYVSRINKLSNKIFGDRVQRYKDHRNGFISWVVSSIEFFNFLLATGMCYNNKKGYKNFPHVIIRSPKSVQRAFLQGYFIGDGTFKWDKACAGTVSKPMCDALCLLLRSFGIFPKIMIEHPKGGNTFYNIHITNTEELNILINSLGITPPKTWKYPLQTRGRKFLHNINSYYYKYHPVGDTRYGVKIRKKLTHHFLKQECLGINKDIDELVKNNIYSVKIKNIEKIGVSDVFDFITTGDKILVANGFYTRDCVFGLMFGRGSKAIAKQYNIPQEKAEAIKELFFGRYPRAKRWLYDQVNFARENLYVRSWLGRIRRLPEIISEEMGIRAEAERQARNSPIQSLASDMNNHFMVCNLKRAKKASLKCYPIGTVHDANIIMVKENQAAELVSIMKDVLNTAFPDFRCPMKLDFEVGKTLGVMEKFNG